MSSYVASAQGLQLAMVEAGDQQSSGSCTSKAGLSSGRLHVSKICTGTPSGVLSGGSFVVGSVGGGESGNDSVAAAVMSEVFPTPSSPITQTRTGGLMPTILPPTVSRHQASKGLRGSPVRGAKQGPFKCRQAKNLLSRYVPVSRHVRPFIRQAVWLAAWHASALHVALSTAAAAAASSPRNVINASWTVLRRPGHPVVMVGVLSPRLLGLHGELGYGDI